MKRALRRSAIAAAAGLLAFVAAAAMEVSPKSPTACDVITLKVQRSFTEDCLWEAAPRVRRDGGKIDVTLYLKGRSECDHALTDRTFEVPVGTFPAGKYLISVRWSDGGAVESKRLEIAPARKGGK